MASNKAEAIYVEHSHAWYCSRAVPLMGTIIYETTEGERKEATHTTPAFVPRGGYGPEMGEVTYVGRVTRPIERGVEPDPLPDDLDYYFGGIEADDSRPGDSRVRS